MVPDLCGWSKQCGKDDGYVDATTINIEADDEDEVSAGFSRFFSHRRQGSAVANA